MSKILQTQLPIATGNVSPETFNRLVRILEINLGAVDPDQTRQVNDADKTTLNFLAGSIIWNTTLGVLQVYTGNQWIQLHTPRSSQGFEMAASVGSLSVKTNGNISINITAN